MDRLKPVFSYQPVISQQPPQGGRPLLSPAQLTPSPLTLALLTTALLNPTSPTPLQRAKGMKKHHQYSSSSSPGPSQSSWK